MWFNQKTIIALAPMADMTDAPFCKICREVSGKEFVIFREMVSSEAVIRRNKKTLRMCHFEKKEQPLVLQIFGSNSNVMAETANILVEKFRPDGIDINMGCPVPKITGKSFAGSALMKEPKKAKEIIVKIKKQNLRVPISVKTRLGWSKDNEILEFAKVLEDAGADLITVHGRTKTQGYSGAANYKRIGEVKKSLSIPVVANGDIKSFKDIKGCLDITKADGVMIGRGALGNPWIFKNIKKQNSKLSKKELISVVLKHAKLHEEHYGKGSLVTFRKHLAFYFKGKDIEEMKNLKKLRQELMQIKTVDELNSLFKFLSQFFYY